VNWAKVAAYARRVNDRRLPNGPNWFHIIAEGRREAAHTKFENLRENEYSQALPDCQSEGVLLTRSETASSRSAIKSLIHDGAIAVSAGVALGTAAGLIGVGGGEFRIPVLLLLLRLDVKTAAGVNLVVGFFTVALAFMRRWTQQGLPSEDLAVIGILLVASILGSLVGARQAHRLPAKPLKTIVLAYLLVVGTWMIVEAVTHAEFVLLNPHGVARWVLAGVAGFLIAAISSSLGVAGGEMRIPALIYVFGYGVKEAGTISLLASIPTVGTGAWAYRRMGHLPNRALVVALFMAAGSLLGVLVGTSLLPFVDKHFLKGLLGGILLLATVCLALPGFFKQKVQMSPRHPPA
jgi:uncharacterized membrane protein YfcA